MYFRLIYMEMDGEKPPMNEHKIEDLKQEIRDLKLKLEEREQSLPAHSARALQFLQLEDLEEEIEEKEELLERLQKPEEA